MPTHHNEVAIKAPTRRKSIKIMEKTVLITIRKEYLA